MAESNVVSQIKKATRRPKINKQKGLTFNFIYFMISV